METKTITLNDGRVVKVNESNAHNFVLIANSWWDRNSSDIVRVNGRYYRRESPLIVISVTGVPILKKESICFKYKGKDYYEHKNNSSSFFEHEGNKYHIMHYKKDRYNTISDNFGEFFTCYISGELVHLSNSIEIAIRNDEGYGSEFRRVDKRFKTELFNEGEIYSKDKKYIIDKGGVIVKLSPYDIIVYDSSDSDKFYLENVRAGNKNICIGFKEENLLINKDFFSMIDNAIGQSNFNIYNFRAALPSYANIRNANPFYFKYRASDAEQCIKINGYHLLVKDKEKREEIRKFVDNYVERQNAYKIQFAKTENSDNDGENQPIKLVKSFSSSLRTESSLYNKNCIDTNTSKYNILPYKFGVEIETHEGVIEASEMDNLYLKSVTDGSICGAEYVTAILSGDKGVDALRDICKALSESCTVTNSCGLHVHIGLNSENPLMSRLAGLRMLNVALKIEDDIFSILPKSRRGNKFCKDIPKHLAFKEEDDIARLVFGSDSRTFASHSENTSQERYTSNRYYWINLVNMFSKGRRTIEFRCHSGSTNFQKIYNWIKICMAIVHSGQDETIDISSINSLEDLIKTVYKEDSKSLLEYIELRKQTFNNKNKK